MAYDIATFRRPSMMMKESDLEHAAQAGSPNSAVPNSETPTTPLPPEMEIDDEFNLPISLALFILIAYILCGAFVYSLWEDWSFFESCYFVFISMLTIGFGDYVPQHPMRMMASIIYLIFGLALTSMCINVVQTKLSNSFRQASAKIGATIGLSLAEEEGEFGSQELEPESDNPSVHSYGVKKPDNQPPPPTITESGVYDNAMVRDGKLITKPNEQSRDTVDNKDATLRLPDTEKNGKMK